MPAASTGNRRVTPSGKRSPPGSGVKRSRLHRGDAHDVYSYPSNALLALESSRWPRTPALGPKVIRIIQTNAAGDNMHVIDPATNKVVAIIEDIEVPHGISAAPDGSVVYITNESMSTMDVDRRQDVEGDQADSAERAAEQPDGQQGRQEGLRRHRPVARRGRRHRRDDADQRQERDGRRLGPQRVRHAGRQVRCLGVGRAPASSA